MNQRIRELAKSVQCQRHWTEEDIEKFARLMVRECVDFLKDTLDDHFAAEQLKEHFRIKI